MRLSLRGNVLAFAIALLALLAVLPALAQPGPDHEHDGKVVMFGNLHAHSHLSDDIQPFDKNLSPRSGFRSAKANGLDFLAISDHHKAVDSPHRLFMTPKEYQEKLLDVAQTFNAENPGFVAIPAIEWGNTATGNHVNVFALDELPPNSVEDRDYDELYEWVKTHAAFVNFNHPKGWEGEKNRDKSVGNYGEALYNSKEDFAAGAGAVARSISIISSVAGGHINGQHRRSTKKTHREMDPKSLGHYHRLLNLGFHLAPAANQDTHWRNWGTVTAARTAAWADSPTLDALMDAFRVNRAYATEDDELAVAYQVEYKGKTYWMGETVPIDGDEATVDVLVRAWQVEGSDNHPTDEGPYTVEIMSDFDGIGEDTREAARWQTETAEDGVVLRIPLEVVDGEYLYLIVTEQNGKDNPIGDGDDTQINATGKEGKDGKRDDLNDSAWTAPIWFVKK